MRARRTVMRLVVGSPTTIAGAVYQGPLYEQVERLGAACTLLSVSANLVLGLVIVALKVPGAH